MPLQTCTGALLQCSFGAAPAPFTPTFKPVLTSNMPAGNILDFAPMMNVGSFAMCSSLANPVVAAATAAAFGVLTPMPCVPATVAPWVPGAVTVLLCNVPALDNVSKLVCMWGGMIQFITPGQMTEQIP